MLQLSLCAARALMLAAQGLLTPPAQAATKADVLAAIRRMGALQIDTIQVVARSPYLVLWSRLGPYEPRWLDELLAEGVLFEYWSHAACFLPIEDFALYRPAMRQGWAHARAWLAANPAEAAQVLDRLRERGAVRSADFAHRRPGRWLVGLEAGEAGAGMPLCHRRADDRPARPQLPARLRPSRARAAGLGRGAHPAGRGGPAGAGAQGGAGVGGGATQLGARLLPLARTRDGGAARGARRRRRPPARRHRGAGRSRLRPPRPCNAGGERRRRSPATGTDDAALPLRPAGVAPRPRQELFGFGYRIETYTPSAQRRYGYFSLPILHRDALIGRLDAKAHRTARTFEVRALHLEPGVPATGELVCDLAAALRACAAWHGTPEVVIRQSDPPDVAAALSAALGR